ncbi:hypothetical protein R53140_OCIKHKEL_00377 [Fructobacillus fructosus]|uniref:hypothetical protein n=1 Tax=Fructobacillus fructosus TaxID=1631 RepID=UPI002DA61E1D|nr:hypothetical protein R53140_OCIKHKEL_00377 [Fructobacillus fructosus]
MVNFLLPITFFSKNYTNSIAETTAMVAFPVFIFIILIQLFRFPERMAKVVPSQQAFLLGGLFWLFQLVAMFFSYQVTGETPITSGLLHSTLTLITWTMTVYVAWAVIQVTVISTDDEVKFVRSGLLGLLFYLILVVFPQLTISLHIGALHGYVNELAHLFERRWVSRDHYNFYTNGSYVATSGRINGFEPEAAFLANLVGVVYLPILIGLTVTKKKIWKWTKTVKVDQTLNFFYALIIFSLLIFVKSTTGILTAVVGCSLWLIWSKGGLRRTLGILTSLAILVGLIAYLKIGFIHNLLNEFLFAKGGTDNRLGGSIGLFRTFLTHGLIGVGYGFTSYFTVQNVPAFTTHNFEFQQVYSQYGYPNLSDLLGWFAAFGLIIMVPAFFLLFRLVARTYFVKYRLAYLALSDEEKSWSRALIIAFMTMIVLAAFSSFFVIQVFLWPYLLMFFFYRRHILRLEQEIQK